MYQNMKIEITDEVQLMAVCDTGCRTNGAMDKEYTVWRDVIRRC